jgi:hypothetical protein
MKGTFFNKPLEWNIETIGESWQQGHTLKGVLSVKNHGTEIVRLEESGVGLALAEIKKIQTRSPEALKLEKTKVFNAFELPPGSISKIDFSFELGANASVTDKKASYYLGYGRNFSESLLQVKVEPKSLYAKIVGLLDTFYRFKLKEFRASKSGVEYKLLPPTARDMANIDSLLLTFRMEEETLMLTFDFQVKKLDTSGISTKINKDRLSFSRALMPKDYSLGKDMIHQDSLLKTLEGAIGEAKMKAVF